MKIKKTIICAISALLLSSSVALAKEAQPLSITRQKDIMQVGYRVLNANQIDKRVTFLYTKTDTPQIRALSRTKRILVPKGVIPFFDDDSEIAALLSYNIAKELDNHKGLIRRSGRVFRPMNTIKRNDRLAVDLLVKAGYHPASLIIVLNKTLPEPNWFDTWMTGDYKGSKRMLAIYEYIYRTHPQYLLRNVYETNPYYQNFLITSKKERAKFMTEYEAEITAQINQKPKKSKRQAKQTKSEPNYNEQM